MLNLLAIISPGIFKDMLTGFMKYFKIILIVVVLALLALAGYKLYNGVTEHFEQMQANKELIIKQTAIIEKQEKYIEDLTKQMQNLQESHDKTLQVLENLYKEKEKVTQVTVKRKKKVDRDLSNVDSKPIPEEDKAKERSAILIEDLNGTYCELFPTNCINTGKTP